MDGQPSSRIYQKEVYYRLGIWHLDLTHKNKTRGQVPWMVMINHHHNDKSSTIQNLPEEIVPQTWNFWHIDLAQKIKSR